MVQPAEGTLLCRYKHRPWNRRSQHASSSVCFPSPFLMPTAHSAALAGTFSYLYIWMRSVPPQTGPGSGPRFPPYIRIGIGYRPGSHLYIGCGADRRSAPTHPRTCGGRYDSASDLSAQTPVVPGAVLESRGSGRKRCADPEGTGQTSRPRRSTSRQALFQSYPLISTL